uniref:Uncharacterized protein n=1 Tax=uncultured marine virus TaxID=186617 RepID=A0A0F7LC77_9VIRU|nr:hypothetical protein [uncultured marine virus]
MPYHRVHPVVSPTFKEPRKLRLHISLCCKHCLFTHRLIYPFFSKRILSSVYIFQLITHSFIGVSDLLSDLIRTSDFLWTSRFRC